MALKDILHNLHGTQINQRNTPGLSIKAARQMDGMLVGGKMHNGRPRTCSWAAHSKMCARWDPQPGFPSRFVFVLLCCSGGPTGAKLYMIRTKSDAVGKTLLSQSSCIPILVQAHLHIAIGACFW